MLHLGTKLRRLEFLEKHPRIGLRRGVGGMNLRRNENEPKLLGNAHPDLQGINDWFAFGPRDGRIEEIVRILTLEKDHRLVAVEDEVVWALPLMLEDTGTDAKQRVDAE